MTTETKPRFSNEEELEQLGEYKRFNLAAAVAFVLGLCSAGMLLNLFLWLVPSLAIFFGVLALAKVRRSPDTGGYALAWIGITCALLFTSWACSSLYFQRLSVYREAQVVAENWFSLVFDGEAEIAHQAMLHPSVRQAAGLSVDNYYALDEDARKDKDKVFAEPPISLMVGLGDDGKVELIDNVTQDVDLTYAKLIRQVYRVSGPSLEPMEIMVSITRAWKEDLGRASWIVAEVNYAEKL